MVLGVLTAVGVSFVAGFVVNALYNNAGQEQRDEERLRKQHNELKEKRSKTGCCYFFTLFVLYIFLLALGGVLYFTDFFRNKKSLGKLILDSRYWFDKDYQLFNYNYYGIGGVALAVVVVIFPLLCFLYKACSDVKRLEKELKDVQDKLQQTAEHDGHGAGSAHAEGGFINIAIGSCFNIFCTCYLTLVTSSTVLAFLSVIVFVCYVLYFYTFK